MSARRLKTDITEQAGTSARARIRHDRTFTLWLRSSRPARIVRGIVRVSAFQTRDLRIGAERPDTLALTIRRVFGGWQHVGRDALFDPILQRGQRIETRLGDACAPLKAAMIEARDHEQAIEIRDRLRAAHFFGD